jgi:maltooligosyltrehalose trehalohydrolase
VLENEKNEARWLTRDDTQAPRLHTAQWNDDIHHCWHVLLTGESDAYYEDFVEEPVAKLARCLAEGFAYQGEPFRHTGHRRGEPSGHLPPSAFVAFLQNHDQIGNRAMGERISALAPPDKLVLARAGLILSPQIPMLYMGEEWAASSPFQFFVDFAPDEELSKAVREGRRREFSRFPAFADPEAAARIPDPTDEATFVRSRLEWEEAARSPHRDVREEVRGLLRLRHVAVVPLTKTRYRGAQVRRPSSDALEVNWRFDGGDLSLWANFGGEPVMAEVPEGGRVLWISPGLRPRGREVELAPWTGIFHVVDRV